MLKIKKKASKKKVSNVQKLMNAGVIPALHAATLSAADRRTLGKMSVAEVAAVIRLKDKLGLDFIQRNVNIPHAFFF